MLVLPNNLNIDFRHTKKETGRVLPEKNGVRRSKILGTFETEKQAKLAEKLRAEELKRENPEYMIAGGPYASGPGFARLNPNSKGGTHKYRRYNKKRRLKASAPSLTL